LLKKDKMNQDTRHFDFMETEEAQTEVRDSSEKSFEPAGDQEKKNEKKADAPEPVKQKSKIRIKELIDGTFLVRENMLRQLPFLLFLTFLGVVYIANRFHAEHMVREINDLKVEVRNLRSEQITITSELMNISRPSEVAALVESKGLNLKESVEPPKKMKR
jgi:hypothetical protein